jgi:hypothetical protein
MKWTFKILILFFCTITVNCCSKSDSEVSALTRSVKETYQDLGISKIERYYNKAGEEPYLNTVLNLYPNGNTKDSILTPKFMSGSKDLRNEYHFNQRGQLVYELKSEEITGRVFSVELYPYGDVGIKVKKKIKVTHYDSLGRDTLREITINDRYNFKYSKLYTATGYEYLGVGPIGETLEHGLVEKDEVNGLESIKDLLTGRMKVTDNSEWEDSMKVDDVQTLHFTKYKYDNTCKVYSVTTLGDSVKVQATFDCDFNMPMGQLKQQKNLNLLYENTTRYNSHGDRVMSVEQDGAGNITSYWRKNIIYNNQGLIREVISYDQLGDVTDQEVTEYDEAGRILSEKSVDHKTASILEEIYTYDNNGLLLKKVEVKDGELRDEITNKYF